MPQMGVTGATTFSQIQQQFDPVPGGKDHNIRFQDGKGLYTSEKASLASVKALFGFREQLEQRNTKREDGVTQIKQAIDNEFGNGLGDRVLKHLHDAHGVDLTHGIKRSDLALIRRGIDEVRLQDLRDAALNDPDRAALESNRGQIVTTTILRYFTNHFEVCSSPAFWAHGHARQNSDNFGCTLSICVLDRVQQNGTITQKDIDDLQRVLGPYEGPGVTPAPNVPNTLLGQLTDAKLGQMAQLVFDRYFDTQAQWPMNLSGSEHQNLVQGFNGATTGAQRLQVLHTGLQQSLGSQYMGGSNLSAPLNGIT
jgi:hypothetical protein